MKNDSKCGIGNLRYSISAQTGQERIKCTKALNNKGFTL